MAINGIETLIYAVDDVAESTRFFIDFGLNCVEQTDDSSHFILPEGSHVRIVPIGAPSLPTKTQIEGTGVHEVIWGVDTQEALDNLIADLSEDHALTIDKDGTAHFLSEVGVPMGLRLFNKKPVVSKPAPLNAPGYVGRLNHHRRWRLRAYPKVIAHVVFAIPNFESAHLFLTERLNFKLSDLQRNFGMYLRADGTNNHHTILLLNANVPIPGMDGKLRFHHANFGVEDIDEIMVGANHMLRCGWGKSHLGLGRHRLDSALFYYIPCPTGGEAEYGTDGDYLDDSWVPRDWTNPLFGYSHFVHNLPDFLMNEPTWDFKYITNITPSEEHK
jgi:catechol 2,3-dioxygenase-like lactoylglutathione lyase family enzyme